jgi:hypothetical protein
MENSGGGNGRDGRSPGNQQLKRGLQRAVHTTQGNEASTGHCTAVVVDLTGMTGQMLSFVV